MFKKVLIAAAVLIAGPSLVSAQDIFWSFSPTELVTEFEFAFPDPCGVDSDGPLVPNGGAGSVYIFSDGLFGFDFLDLNFTGSESRVRFTGGEAFNPTFTTIGGMRFSTVDISIDPFADSGTLFALGAGPGGNGIHFENGVDPVLGPLYDPGFDAGVGPNGAVLLARVDFEMVGSGDAEFELALGSLGVGQFSPSSNLNPSFGSATATVIFPHVGFCPHDANGDIDHSGVADFLDIAPFIRLLQSSSSYYQIEADINFDGVVDFLDIPGFIAILARQ